MPEIVQKKQPVASRKKMTLEKQLLKTFTFGEGYFDTDILAVPDNCLAPGSQNIFITSSNSQRIFRGLHAPSSVDSGRTMFNVAGGWAALKDVGSTRGLGSVFNYINESLFFIGAGEVMYNGAVLVDTTPSSTNFTATSNLQLSPKVAGPTYNEAYVAGLAEPDAPVVFARTQGVGDPRGLMTGTYSFKIARVRSVTGGRSIASLTSAIITCASQAVRITFPALDSNGQDRWAIFGTKAGFGGVGVHYLIEEVADTSLTTIDGVPRSYIVNYNDSDLLPIISYIDDYPPQAGTFAARLENYVLVFGTADNTVQCSLRNFPESYHPEHIGFLPKAPTALLPDPQGSYLYVSTDSSVHAVSVVPGTENPLIMQTVWSDVGVANNHNWCSVEGVLFAFTAKTGAVTMGSDGRPSSEFAEPVAKAMREWAVADVVVLHCPHLNSVVYCYGSDAYAFNLQNGKWSSPAKMSDWTTKIVSGVVVDRQLKVTILDGSSNMKLYNFDVHDGSADISYIAVSPWIAAARRVNLLGIRYAHYAPEITSVNAYLEFDYAAAGSKNISNFSVADTMQTSRESRWWLPRKESYRVRFASMQSDFTKDCYISFVQVYGTEEESVALWDA